MSISEWKVGETRQVGYLNLKVKAIRYTGTGTLAILVSKNGKMFEFKPYLGLKRISLDNQVL